MITFHIITIFPDIFDSYFKEGILRRAKLKRKIKIKIYNLRDFTDDKHKKVDARPFGGGPGMVLKVEPIKKAVEKIKKNTKKKTKVILFSAKGKKFDQKKASIFSKFDDLILICGRYEGVDERVAKYIADEELSIGDFVLSGGELGAILVLEAVSRLVPGVLGNKESIEDERKIKSYSVYTRPERIKIQKKERKVPEVLLSGNHADIEKWRKKNKK